MEWNPQVRQKLDSMIVKIPVFHRRITEVAVTKVAEESAKKRNASFVEEEDVVGAFFSGVPSPFYSMMVRLLEQSGFDYKQYGYGK